MELAVFTRYEAPTRTEWAAAGVSAILLILSFPKFDLSSLAWISLVPLLFVVVKRPAPLRALILGWAFGTIFFYGSCYWLTFSMIHYGGLPTVLAYVLLIPGAVVVGIFPGLFASLLALVTRRWGPLALLLAPVFWPALEWARLNVTGQLWNALGYSQAYHPSLIRAASWGGVYAVSSLILTINAALTLLLIGRTKWTVTAALLAALLVAIVYLSTQPAYLERRLAPESTVQLVALQPNVPMNFDKTIEETRELLQRHLSVSADALKTITDNQGPRLVVWPESPMNFTYASDKAFQEVVAKFTRDNHTSLLFNSLEPAPGDGFYNSAMLVNEDGRLISQYDKIRLMPFGEYVPLPQWLPGASLITAIVGDFTPGSRYTLMPVGDLRFGVFICIESAYPSIARRLTNEGADVLINISNDGYLGPTAVMRQHLANAIFRAVENDRPIARVTNSGVSTWIEPEGFVTNPTPAFQTDVRVWTASHSFNKGTFYTRHGDLFVHVCAVISVLVFLTTLFSRRRSFRDLR